MEPLVVYIIGDSRSGSTLLDYLLSAHPDTVSVGELHHLSNFYNKVGIVAESWNYKCGCGQLIRQCAFWVKILNSVNFSNTVSTKINYKIPRWYMLSNNLYKKIIDKVYNSKIMMEKGHLVAGNCWKIYHEVINQTGKHIVIDSSKNALQAAYLNKYRQGSIRFLIIEREICATSYSKMNRINERIKKLKEIDSIYHKKAKTIYSLEVASYSILKRNRYFAKMIQQETPLKPVIKKVRYSDLVNETEKTIEDICSFIGIEKFRVPNMTNQNRENKHVISGSPSRYLAKPIKPDTRWRAYYKNKKFALWLGTFLQRKLSKD